MSKIGGEYTTDETEQLKFREVLLSEIEATAPGLLESLRDEVLPTYLEAWPRNPELESIPAKLFALIDQDGTFSDGDAAEALLKQLHVARGQDSPPALHSLPRNLEAALASWASAHHIADDWMLELALSTLHRWHTQPEFQKELTWTRLSHRHHLLAETEATFRFRWQPDLEPRVEANRRLKKIMDRIDEEYRDSAHDVGLSSRKAKAKHSGRLHFDWLVLFHFAGLSYAEISRRDQKDQSHVRKSVKDTAKRAGFNLRVAERGRPRKNRGFEKSK